MRNIDHQSSPAEERPGKVTLLTLLAQGIGIMAVLLHWSVGLMIVGIVLLPKWRNMVPAHNWRMIAELTVTTYFFGIVDGLCLHSIMEYV